MSDVDLYNNSLYKLFVPVMNPVTLLALIEMIQKDFFFCPNMQSYKTWHLVLNRNCTLKALIKTCLPASQTNWDFAFYSCHVHTHKTNSKNGIWVWLQVSFMAGMDCNRRKYTMVSRIWCNWWNVVLSFSFSFSLRKAHTDDLTDTQYYSVDKNDKLSIIWLWEPFWFSWPSLFMLLSN